jgi:hypothetical protein
MLKRLAAMFCCAMLFAVLPITAGQWDKKTTVTFSAPVELPGIVLPAGTYVFKLADIASERHVVQVFNADETHIYATILAIPNYRLTPAAETVVRFEERPKGTPEAIRAWFYPADTFGQEFVYPKGRATELAETARVPVLAAELPPAEKPEELINEPVVTITPENKEVEMAQVTPQLEAALPEVEPAAAELPRTASPLPLFILVGLCSLVIAGVLRVVSKVTA